MRIVDERLQILLPGCEEDLFPDLLAERILRACREIEQPGGLLLQTSQVLDDTGTVIVQDLQVGAYMSDYRKELLRE